ncbi:hypothetical protein ACE1TI_15425 [Alteribacillus sp. JSM 102045]|uniref:hypothetical protein n=1 Tax=Alteribacillus sp. JSM 102045 TaxID=1562101 RepID=UPI0035BF415B
MKKRYSSDERLKQKLQQLPQVHDSRSKDEIYQNVMKHKEKTPRKPQAGKWVFPTLSAAAAVLLLLVLLPNMSSTLEQFSSNEESVPQEQQQAGESSAEDTQETEENESNNNESDSSEVIEREENDVKISEEEEEPAEETETNEEPPVEVGEKTPVYENYVTALTKDDIEQGEKAVTIPLQDLETSVIVPITFLIKESQESLEAFEELTEVYTGEDVGLDPSALQDIDWKSGEEEETPLEAEFEEEMPEASSSESEMIVKSLEESMRYLGENEVVLEHNGAEGVELGNYGVLDHYTIEQENRGYYVYTTNEDMSFLVSGNAANISTKNEDGELFTFFETLEQMKTAGENSSVEASIPQDMTIEDVKEENDLARVVFSGDSHIPENENGRLMIEAVLFAAADFGFERVSFEGENLGEAEGYSLNDPIDVPVAPNQIEQ